MPPRVPDPTLPISILFVLTKHQCPVTTSTIANCTSIYVAKKSMKRYIAADESLRLRQEKERRTFEMRCASSSVDYGLMQTPPQPLLMPQTSYWVASLLGKMRDMEDAVMVEPAFTRTASEFAWSHELDFFAVYDGHGGSQVANACKERMHLILAEEVAKRWPMIESELGCWENTMVESFRRLDAEVGANKELIIYDGIEPGFGETVGSTALAAVVGKKSIIVANCGISRAILSRGGTTVALSSDHKPNRQDEMQRIEAAGGKVIESDGYRVWGILTTSRSIGDYKLKPCVICEPEVTITERVEEDEFLILASDGLWDVISNEMACYIVRSCLFAGSTPTDPASLLAKIAISRGSRDNISVIVVQLNTPMRC